MKKLAVAAILTVILGAWSPGVYASEYHVDPDTVTEVYSGIALLRYYSDSLDFVIQKDPSKTEEHLGLMPLAHVPPTITNSAADFGQSAIAISQALPEIDQLFAQRDTFIAQSRLVDALNTSDEISADIKQALGEVDTLEQSSVLTGDNLKVAAASAQSDLRLTYDEVLGKIERIRAMLNLLSDQLQNSHLEKLSSLQPTNLVLEITPLSAFVGDNVHFDAMLTCKGQPLPGREVYILLNGSQYITATTDANGRCSGELAVPFWYVPQIEAQAFYQPQADDLSLFLASMSPTTTINVLFYKASLNLSIDGNAYPGRTATIKGNLDYGTSPPLNNRKLSLYVDDALVAELNANTEFSFPLVIGTQIPLGQHSVTLSALANGRYGPAVVTTILEVKRTTPVLVLSTPRVAFVPGVVRLSGKSYSELGPLDGAIILIGSGNSHVEVTTASDGTFSASLKISMGFTLLGSQALSVQVAPAEPWNGPLSDTRNMFSVNYVNCSLVAVILAFLGIYMPNRIRKRLGSRRAQTYGMPEEITLDLPPAYDTATIVQPLRDAAEEQDKPRSIIFYWYRQVLKFVQKLAGLKPRPQQTMREFAKESSSTLGPISRYLMEITFLVERFLYSSHEALQSDVNKSQELSQAIRSEDKDEAI